MGHPETPRFFQRGEGSPCARGSLFNGRLTHFRFLESLLGVFDKGNDMLTLRVTPITSVPLPWHSRALFARLAVVIVPIESVLFLP